MSRARCLGQTGSGNFSFILGPLFTIHYPLAVSSVYFGNSVRAWVIAALIAAIIYFVLAIARRILISRLGSLAERTETDVDEPPAKTTN